LGFKKTMYLDYETKRISDKERLVSKIKLEDFCIVQNEDFEFSYKLFRILSDNLAHTDFKSEKINELIGLSKSQAYRKIKSLTGIAPNQLIQEFRLRNSLKYLKNDCKTISEIAFDSGFNSPTYFAKVFRKRFSITPTYFTKISKSQ